jgi:hypothetical protein
MGVAAPAFAHFRLVVPPPVTASPQSVYVEDSLGLPQLSAPCGQADPDSPAVATNVVSTLKAGGMVTISFDETIFHPGHYRIALAADQGSLPADPDVVAGDQACGTTTIEDPPVAPVLADGVLVHTAAFNGTQTVMVPLPATPCTNCVLQITEFMSEHGLNNPGGCFYHHCMNVNITLDGPLDAGVSTPDAAPVGEAPDGGVVTGGKTGGGCDADDVPGTATFASLVLALLVGARVFRRR